MSQSYPCPECGVDELEVHTLGCSRDPHAKYRKPEDLTMVDNGALSFMKPPPINLCFSDENGKVGEFLWDEENRIWTFTGDADASAQIFIDFLIKSFGERLLEPTN